MNINSKITGKRSLAIRSKYLVGLSLPSLVGSLPGGLIPKWVGAPSLGFKERYPPSTYRYVLVPAPPSLAFSLGHLDLDYMGIEL